MFSRSNIAIHGGTINYQNRTSKGMDILMEWVATGAFHNSDELYDAPKCHPHTRVAVLDDIMKWVGESDYERDKFMMWLFGPAGAGKSAIAKRIAEIAAEMDLLIADFFFSRTSPTRNTRDRLIATLAYQLAVSIPDTRSYVEEAIERDPAIFNKNVRTQIDTLLIKPFQSISAAQIVPSQKLIIIDGLDECNDSQAQLSILEAISHSFTQHKLPIKLLVASRPEIDLVTSFNCNEPLRYIHRRLVLDDTYQPDDDIRIFLSDKFEQIRLTHPLRSTIPITWPTQEILDTLVAKSSGQFIYASTVVKFVKSSCHRPTVRLNIILGTSPPGTLNPFAELDALYNHLLSSVDDIQLTLRVLSFYVMTPNFAPAFRYPLTMSPELFLSLEPGDIQLALINLSSIITYHESSGAVDILHASLVDFLSDKSRSTIFYIDIASTCADFVRRVLQYVKGPDGIRAGDNYLFLLVFQLFPWIPKGQHCQLWNDILSFDVDAFINASIRWQYSKDHNSPVSSGSTINVFYTCKRFLTDAGLEYGDKNEALDRLNKSLELRLQIYQSNWRLQLLFTLVVTNVRYYGPHRVTRCRCLDILLEMHDLRDHNFHLVDQHALDLRHAYKAPWPRLIDILSHYVDTDTYAPAALQCMRFLSNPPQYSEINECPDMGLITYPEWEATCDTTLEMLCKLLQKANTSTELVQFISNHDIHPEVQKYCSADLILDVNVYILAFLSRASVCANWRMIAAIRRFHAITHKQPSQFQERNAIFDKDEDWETLDNFTQPRLDQCCSILHFDYT